MLGLQVFVITLGLGTSHSRCLIQITREYTLFLKSSKVRIGCGWQLESEFPISIFKAVFENMESFMILPVTLVPGPCCVSSGLFQFWYLWCSSGHSHWFAGVKSRAVWRRHSETSSFRHGHQHSKYSSIKYMNEMDCLNEIKAYKTFYQNF